MVSAALATAFPRAEVFAVDSDAAALDRVAGHGERAGVGSRVRPRQVDLAAGGPDALSGVGTPDLLFASRVVHHLGDQWGSVARLARRLAPGGLLALAEGGLPERFLPSDPGVGRPGLLARVAAAHEDCFALMRAGLPGSVRQVDDWPGMLRAAGLVSTSRSFLLDVPAPLGAAARELTRRSLEAVTARVGNRLEPDDRSALTRLTDPADPSGIIRRDDVFLLSVDSLHVGSDSVATLI